MFMCFLILTVYTAAESRRPEDTHSSVRQTIDTTFYLIKLICSVAGQVMSRCSELILHVCMSSAPGTERPGSTGMLRLGRRTEVGQTGGRGLRGGGGLSETETEPRSCKGTV